MIGWSMPCWRSESASDAMSAGSNWRRGWNGLGSTWSTETWISSAPSYDPGSNPPSSRPSRASSPRPRRRPFTLTVDDLHDEFRIGPGASCPGCVIHHAAAVAGGLADRDVPRDDRVEYGLGEILADLPGDLVGQLEAGVEHRQHDPADLEPRVVARLGLAGQVDDLREALHREVFALDRDEDLARRAQRRPGELPERGGAIQEHVVEPTELARELLAEHRGPLPVGGRQ